jgi:phage portal protein BeeE
LAALESSSEIAERSILSLPAIVSITTVVSANSATLPCKPPLVITLSPTFNEKNRIQQK